MTLSISGTMSTLGGVAVKTGTESAAIANEAKQLTQQLKDGQLTLADYKELMGDLQSEKMALAAADDVRLQQMLMGVFDNVKTAVALVP